jgi:hypothetical protein
MVLLEWSAPTNFDAAAAFDAVLKMLGVVVAAVSLRFWLILLCL